MLIDDVVEFCDNEYNDNICVNCNSKTTCNDHICGCKKCLYDLHFHYNIYRNSYNCERLFDYYVCRYSHKYCSEILYALEECVDLSQYPFFHILSLGCGASPDLMAFDYLRTTHAIQTNKPISFIGLDKNTYLKKIHNYIISSYNDVKVNYACNLDVLKYFQTHSIRGTNVLIIQYLISCFYSILGKDGLRQWFSKIANNIISYKPTNSQMLIIINDNDSIHTGRDSFYLLTEEIEKLGFKVSEQRMRFRNDSYYKNSHQYSSCNNFFEIPNYIKEKYSTAIRCTSAQLILEVY